MAFRRPFFKDKRLAFFAGYKETLQTITITGAASAAPVATRAKPYGTTLIASTGTGATHFVALGEPIPGVRKTVIARMGSTAEVAVVCHSTACLFDGTTFNRLTFSTGADGRTAVDLLGLSTSRWAILSAGAQGNSTASPTPAGFALAGSTVAP